MLLLIILPNKLQLKTFNGDCLSVNITTMYPVTGSL